jgi:F0F1-type ATP synthase assembly protein I
MKPVAWMVAASGAAWILVTATLADRANPEAAWGIAGPLSVAVVSWTAYIRAHHAAPERLTRVMITAFALKLMFFSVYVVAAMRVLHLRPAPFVVSFVGAFIAMHAMEAFSLRRLVLGPPPRTSG